MSSDTEGIINDIYILNYYIANCKIIHTSYITGEISPKEYQDGDDGKSLNIYLFMTFNFIQIFVFPKCLLK